VASRNNTAISEKENMRVHILGLVMLNGGDAAIMSGQEKAIRTRWPDASIHISDANPKGARRYTDLPVHPFLRDGITQSGGGRRARLGNCLRAAHLLFVASLVGRGWLRAAQTASTARQQYLLSALREADLVAYTGGTTLTESYDLRAKLFDLEVARRLRKPMVFLPQSAGPFQQSRNQRALRKVFSASSSIILRDSRSLQHVLDVGAAPERCSVRPDMCFAIADDPAKWRKRPSVAERLRIAISVREWQHFSDCSTEEGMRRYVAAIQASVSRVVRGSQAEVVFLSTCQGRPEYWIDDSALAVNIAEGLDADVRSHVRVDREARSPEELKRALASFDAMLSTRMHGGILAACVGVPALTIAYEYKTREVWRQLGLEKWVCDIESANAETLPQSLSDLLVSRTDVVEQLAAVVPRLQREALSVGEQLERALTVAGGK
jgi:colanic acid/amylovoran biosynthesis protein